MTISAHRLLPLVLVPAAVIGAGVMLQHDVARSRVAIHLASLAFGVALSVVVGTIDTKGLQRIAPLAAVATIACLAATLFGDGLLGVHRWLALGPLQIHVSSLVCAPLVLVGAATCWIRGARARAAGLVLAAQLVHALQPDAGQSTALAIGAIAGLARSDASNRLRFVGGAALALSALPAWIRPDPLPAVPSVEGIVGLARQLGLATWTLAIVSLGLVPLAMTVAVRGATANEAFVPSTVAALTAYVTATVLVPTVGNFPVPVLGFGVSPLGGVALCLGLVGAFVTSDVRGA